MFTSRVINIDKGQWLVKLWGRGIKSEFAVMTTRQLNERFDEA